MSFNSIHRTSRTRGHINGSSNENLSVRCNNDNCRITEVHSNLRLCTRCSRYFCSECTNCNKLGLNALFEEKDIEEWCAIFLESISETVTVLEENCQVNSNNFKALETSIERNSFNIKSCFHSLGNLKERVDLVQKITPSKCYPQ